MDQIAFIIGGTSVYWSSVVMTLAALMGICFFWAFYLGKDNGVVGAAVAVPLALALSMILGRLIHWYCRSDSYEDLFSALTDFTTGGYALLGAFGGCLLTAVLLRALHIIDNAPRMLDSMSVAGCGAIALGRLSCFFTSADRGQILPPGMGLPWASPVANPVSGLVEYRFATFLVQAIAAGVIFVILAVLYLRDKDNGIMKNGDICLLFLLFYGAAQVVLDSTRYDSLFLRINGFVSVVQIFSAVAIVVPVVIVAVRLVRAAGFKPWYPVLWVLTVALIGGAGYMEYYVQRHGNQAVFAYGNMSACLIGVLILTVAQWYLTIRRERFLNMPTIY